MREDIILPDINNFFQKYVCFECIFKGHEKVFIGFRQMALPIASLDLVPILPLAVILKD